MSADDFMNEKVLKLSKPFEETVARRLENSPEPTERAEQTEMQQVLEQLAEMRAMVTEAREELMLAREVQDGSPGDGEMWDLMPMGGDGGGGGGLDGFQFYWAGGGTVFVSMDDAMDGYDPSPIAAGGAGHEHWSIELVVSGSTFTGVWEGTAVLDDGSTAAHLWDGNAAADPVEAQTFYRLNIIRGGKRVCGGGSYRENIFCAGSYGPIVELIGR